jgi:hypothetical protein
MAALDPIQVNRFVQLFPELPAEYADVVMLYAAGAAQVEIAGVNGSPTRRQVEWMLKKTAKRLELHSIQAIRTVVIARLLLSIPPTQQ